MAAKLSLLGRGKRASHHADCLEMGLQYHAKQQAAPLSQDLCRELLDLSIPELKV